MYAEIVWTALSFVQATWQLKLHEV